MMIVRNFYLTVDAKCHIQFDHVFKPGNTCMLLTHKQRYLNLCGQMNTVDLMGPIMRMADISVGYSYTAQCTCNVMLHNHCM